MAKPIEWWKPVIGKQEHKLVKKVLESGFLNDGAITTEFENKIAELLEVKHAVAVTSGTAALFLGLCGSGVKPGDEVLVPDLTFIATANAVKLAGATPILVDVDPKTFNIDVNSAKKAITSKTKAIVPVHVSGRAADMKSILKLAQNEKLFVVEDAAEAFLSKHNGKFLGSFGHVGCFSFSPNKTITTGQGGVVVTNDSDIHRKLRELKDQGRPVRGTGGADTHHSVGYNFKFTDLQAAVGIAQLEDLPSRLKRLKEIYAIYRKKLKGAPGIFLGHFDIEKGESPQWVDAFVKNRDLLHAHLEKSQIFCRKFWFPIHTQKPYKQSDSFFPNATQVSSQAFWLPSAFTLTDKEVSFVCEKILKFGG